MRPVEIYFGFQKPSTWRQAVKDPIAALGHVEAFGFTQDDTWFFINSTRHNVELQIAHKHDEVEAAICTIIARSHTILKIEQPGKLTLPPFAPYSCVAVCAHLAGTRAFTPRGLIRKLRAMDAKEVSHETARRRSEG